MDYKYVFKILLLGDRGVGKTTLTYKYITGSFKRHIKQTIGVDIFSKFLNFNGTEIKFQLWDFGGEERFRSILPKYCKGADVVLLLYDLTNRTSFQHLPQWLKFIGQNAANIPIILIGTKKDLIEMRDISLKKGLKFCDDFNLSDFFEISSLTGKNVDKVFETVLKLLSEKKKLKISG